MWDNMESEEFELYEIWGFFMSLRFANRIIASDIQTIKPVAKGAKWLCLVFFLSLYTQGFRTSVPASGKKISPNLRVSLSQQLSPHNSTPLIPTSLQHHLSPSGPGGDTTVIFTALASLPRTS